MTREYPKPTDEAIAMANLEDAIHTILFNLPKGSTLISFYVDEEDKRPTVILKHNGKRNRYEAQ
ncbi:hypothetical protein BOW53_02880 [Solemya pervernicosa gill symbiont]|uniref:Uncharacterized protein n=1 Tax=Solemya pervernicosa gill symbiont TaxID=642797 RepID=A0A1T2L985_9GAMM|nr:hypothetical protein [Solemya pervernicosa gill symbiont]OOZ41640.1 hypothetical protein BOW53_02880 [Solemya pervernicosa gill symbiont]